MSGNRLIGTLEAYYESGTEGIHWAVIDNFKSGYSALYMLSTGDYLFIEDGNGNIEWEGPVVLNNDIYKKRHAGEPPKYQQQVLGYWVHGLHQFVKPERWAQWFFDQRPAVVIKGGLHGGPPTGRGFE